MNKKIAALIMVVVVGVSLTGCRQSYRVSHNISLQADNFNVMRRLTVFNTISDKCLMQMTGKFSLSNSDENELEIIVELDREKGIYQKHFVYLNAWTTYTVEDLSGANVSAYAYEMEFQPKQLLPVRVTANEIKQDIEEGG